MNSETILKAYLNKFNKTVNEWAKLSLDYSKRNQREEFRHIMIKMDSFLRNYVGPLKYEHYNSEILRHLLRNGLIIKSSNGSYDVSEKKYQEYKLMKL